MQRVGNSPCPRLQGFLQSKAHCSPIAPCCCSRYQRFFHSSMHAVQSMGTTTISIPPMTASLGNMTEHQVPGGLAPSLSGLSQRSSGVEALSGVQALQVLTRGAEASSAPVGSCSSAPPTGALLQPAATVPVACMKQLPVNDVSNTVAGNADRARDNGSETTETSLNLLAQQLDRFNQEHRFLGRFEMLGRSAQRRGGAAFSWFVVACVILSTSDLICANISS